MDLLSKSTLALGFITAITTIAVALIPSIMFMYSGGFGTLALFILLPVDINLVWLFDLILSKKWNVKTNITLSKISIFISAVALLVFGFFISKWSFSLLILFPILVYQWEMLRKKETYINSILKLQMMVVLIFDAYLVLGWNYFEG